MSKRLSVEEKNARAAARVAAREAARAAQLERYNRSFHGRMSRLMEGNIGEVFKVFCILAVVSVIFSIALLGLGLVIHLMGGASILFLPVVVFLWITIVISAFISIVTVIDWFASL